MSERIHLPLARIFTRVVLAGAIMLPFIHAGQAAADTRVRVEIVTPNARIHVVKGNRHARTYPYESYREYPRHRCSSPEYVVVRKHAHVYRVVPERRYWERTPDYRRSCVQYRSYDRGREYDRGGCDSHDRGGEREYDRWER